MGRNFRISRHYIWCINRSCFQSDRYAIEVATVKLQKRCRKLHINDKPTGAVVGQQLLVEQELQGNKAGSPLNLLRWASPRTIKETLLLQ
jgi:1-pyrroline-5-carboxylate dehydrogenase